MFDKKAHGNSYNIEVYNQIVETTKNKFGILNSFHDFFNLIYRVFCTYVMGENVVYRLQKKKRRGFV